MNARVPNPSAYFDEAEISTEILRVLPRGMMEFLKYRFTQDGVYDRKTADDFTVLRERLGNSEYRFTSPELQAFKESFIRLDDVLTDDFGYEARREHFVIHQTRKDEVKQDLQKLFPVFEKAHADLVRSMRNSPATQISLSAMSIKFNDSEAAIYFGDKVCKLPPFKNEHYLCKFMFSQPAAQPIDWSEVSRGITGTDPLVSRMATKKLQRTVKDAVYAVNHRVHEDINSSEDLFTWKELTITRNF
ncbi:hypothetical protein K2Q00_03080 [Patescibacteria group bacterium]|nr:hypothetical protein [Patescibacteria group bacterium]